MTKDPNDTKNPKPEKIVEPKKGGFGAFAEKYRDRWAAGHPPAKKEDRDSQTPAVDGPHSPDVAPTPAAKPKSQ